jgi:undecaprenyl diphosphate synthase
MQPRVPPAGIHLALVMDGNGRWAVARGLPRSLGHRAGARAVRAIVEAAPGLGVGVLTLYAFSADNWKRPAAEVGALMRLLGGYLAVEAERCAANGVRIRVIGRRDRLPAELLRRIEAAEEVTAAGERLLLRIAVDYSARETILRAAALADGGEPSGDAFAELLARASGGGPAVPGVDLLVRTGGERRLSDFLLWECAYAELFFSAVPWPDFVPARLEEALDWYRDRDRRFGALRSA